MQERRFVSPVESGAEPFASRVDAGIHLGRALERYRGRHALVLGIPRGGVPVAAEVARALDGELDVIVARKLGSPFSSELAVGAVTADGALYLNPETRFGFGMTAAWLDRMVTDKVAEARQREERFRGRSPPLQVEGRTVILVDDGLATGSTMIAAARSLRRRHPARLVIAVPVGPPETCERMRDESDEVICLRIPEFFLAVGLHYIDFSQTEDEDVERILREFRLADSRA